MSTVRYQIQVFSRDGSQVDFTLESELGSVPVVGGQAIRFAQGRAESRPWAIDVIDADEIITQHLADPATGRTWLLGRVVGVRQSIDGGPWQDLDTGRLTAISEADGPGLYTLQIYDERWVERQAVAFDQELVTTQIYPAGTLGRFRGEPQVSATLGEWREADSTSPLHLYVRIKLDHAGPISQQALDFMRSFLARGDDGSRPNRRLTLYTESVSYLDPATNQVVWGAELPIVGIGKRAPWRGGSPTEGIDGFDPRRDRFSRSIWAGPVPAGSWREGRHIAYIPGLVGPPTRDLPHHIGIQEGEVPDPLIERHSGIDPFELVQQEYDRAGVRYDPAALDALKGRYPQVAFRVTRTHQLAQWLEDEIYGPLLVTPFTDAKGRVAPRSVALPIMSQEQYDNLFVFDASNIAADGHPTWDHTSRDRVNVLHVETVDYIHVSDEEARVESDYGLDRIKVVEDTVTIEHNNLQHVPRSELTISARGFWGIAREGIVETLAREMFDRFGDGPIRGTMVGLRSTESVQPGDFVRIELDTYPNPALQGGGRGGSRIVQVLSRIAHPDGFEFEFLDVGAALQPVPAPNLSVTPDADDPYHTVRVTISGLVSGAQATLQVSHDPNFSRVVRSLPNLEEGETRISGLPSGMPVYVRAIATMPQRIRGAWSSTRSANLQALPAPSALAASSITRHTAFLSWTTGSMDRSTEVLLARGSAPSEWSDEHVVATLDPGATEYLLTFLDGPNESYTAAVRHIDRYGGVSGVATRTITTTSAVAAAPRPAGIEIVAGVIG